jgi:23S rRNA (cytosine1962-C5)-methyltransferase
MPHGGGHGCFDMVTALADRVTSMTPSLPSPAERLREELPAALARRGAIGRVTTAYRVVDGAADGCPGIVVDRYDDWAVLSLTDPVPSEVELRLARALVDSFARGVYVKRRPRADLRRQGREELAPPGPILGEAAPADLVVTEHGMRVRVALGDGLSTGLFTDQRDNRRLVRDLAEGRSVLNLFAYTCTFTVAAAVGGATATVSVDLSGRALERGGENLSLNDAAGPRHRLIRTDAIAFVARAARKDARFDVIVLDPPSFGTRGRGTFSVERDYAALARSALALLSPRGRLLAVTNHRKTSSEKLRAMLRGAAHDAGRTITSQQDLPVPADHAATPDGAPPTKSALVTVA